MPILKSNNKLVYFSHIPKCGGASVEAYLHKISNGNVAFVDNQYNFIKQEEKWTNSSPQHIDGQSLIRLFPETFFDAFFAVVRDPIKRFESAFNFQKNVEKNISPDTEINEFVSRLNPKNILRIGHFDGHFMPQFMFLHPRASYKIFKLEDGMDRVKEYLDKLLFENVLNEKFFHLNAKRQEHDNQINRLSSENKEKLKIIYKQDYQIFKY